ncbi:MAG: RNA polymerase factor sigma-54, partial [Thermoanaerobaculia bacterium]
MALEQKLSLRLSQRLVMTPSLQQAIKLLQMSKLELEEVLTQEMVENPLLEEEQEEAPSPEEAREAAAEAPAPTPGPAETAAPQEKDSFEEIDFDSYFAD